MARLRNLMPPPIFLAICGFGLALVSLQKQQAWPPISSHSAMPISASKPELQTVTDLHLTPSDRDQNRLALAKQRPLFSETRRLPKPVEDRQPVQEIATPQSIAPEPIAPAPQPEPIQITLPKPEMSYRGHMKLGGTSRGLVYLPQSRQERWVNIGDVIEGWSVAKVSERELVLQLNGEIHIVELIR